MGDNDFGVLGYTIGIIIVILSAIGAWGMVKKPGGKSDDITDFLEIGTENERSELILNILDKIIPFPDDLGREEHERIDAERQALVLRSGWTMMPLEDLREVAAGRALNK